MSVKLLNVVYDKDLPQFELMTYCLNKNWAGTKHITIIYQGNIQEQVSTIVEKNFNQDWKVELLSSPLFKTLVSGSDLQQTSKVIYSIDHSVQDVIVFDCKDFLLKPLDEHYFKRNGLYSIAKSTELFENLYPNVYKEFGPTQIKLEAILNLTPWIWNVNQLQRYWEFVTSKHGKDLNNWDHFYPRSEVAGYYFYTKIIDPNPCISFDQEFFMPSGGIWDSDNFKNNLQVTDNFDKYNSVVWKHHQRINDFNKTIITAMQLQKYKIPTDVIINWVEKKHNILL